VGGGESARGALGGAALSAASSMAATVLTQVPPWASWPGNKGAPEPESQRESAQARKRGAMDTFNRAYAPAWRRGCTMGRHRSHPRTARPASLNIGSRCPCTS
jgi:hypothetical protein